jgi:asparagine synthase (glutamine-hydrolysing)
MSKISGIFNFTQENVAKDKINLELQSRISSIEEKPNIFLEKNVWLFQQNFNSQVESSTDKASYNNTNSELFIVADADLTNRSELFIKLNVPSIEQKKTTDNDLILKSYEKWGEVCPEHLVGDFAFAIWDKQKQNLFCCRDHFGASSLFYYKDDERFIFASQPKGILDFGNVEKKFNKNKLAIYLLPEAHTLTTDQTWFENIFPFPAGTSLTIDKNGIKSRKFWKPELGQALPYKTEEEILEAFQKLFFEIVEARLQNASPAASLLSGGLDSSAIVSVAAKILLKQNRSLNAFAGVLSDYENENISDERYYIDQFKSFPNVKINYITAPNAGPFSDVESFFENNDSPYITSRHYLYKAFSKAANKIGAGTLFDGCFGELGATFHGHGGFAEMFAHFKWITLWRELKLRKKLYNDSIKYNVRANVINPLLPQFLIDLRHGQSGNKLTLNKYNPLQSELTKNLLSKVPINSHLQKRISPNHRKNQINDLIFIQEKMNDHFPLNYNEAPVELRYPMLDKRLIEFALAVPLNLKFRDGYSRYLIRAGLDKILPPEIQWRTSKTPFSPDYMRRYNSQIGEVRELLESIKPNDPIREILDIDRIKEWANLKISDAERHSYKEEIARDHLPQAIYLIYFLRKFSEFRI